MNEYINKKLYIATVGTGASGTDIAHALFQSLNQYNPDTAVFIVSKETKIKTLPFIEEKIKSHKPTLEYFAELEEEINEFEELHNSFVKIILKYIKQGYEKSNIIVDYTSGTKAMSAALVSAGIFIQVGRITYTYGKRGDGGRVQSGSEKTTSLSPNLFITGKKFSEAKLLFNKNLFEGVINLLSSFEDLPHPDFSTKIQFIIQLSHALNNWDKFEFGSAFEILNQMKKDENMLHEAKYFGLSLEKFTQTANTLKEKKLNDFLVCELISNAGRRATEGKYDDAVARLYRALEMIGQIEFEKQFGCSTSDVKIENIPEQFREGLLSKYFDSKAGQLKMPLFGSLELLMQTNEKYKNLLSDKIQTIKRILDMRNHSILAHGSVPLSEKKFVEAQQIISDVIKSFLITAKVPQFPKLA